MSTTVVNKNLATTFVGLALVIGLTAGTLTVKYTVNDECAKIGSFTPRVYGNPVICNTIENIKKGLSFGNK
jgi:hypothetical protein